MDLQVIYFTEEQLSCDKSGWEKNESFILVLVRILQKLFDKTKY